MIKLNFMTLLSIMIKLNFMTLLSLIMALTKAYSLG